MFYLALSNFLVNSLQAKFITHKHTGEAVILKKYIPVCIFQYVEKIQPLVVNKFADILIAFGNRYSHSVYVCHV